MPIDSTRLDLALRTARAHIDPHEADLLLAHALGKPRSWLYAHADAPLPPPVAERFAALTARRERGEPVAYLTGRAGFYGLELAVTPDTLIPRPETELLVDLALERLPPYIPARVLDLGTGSGAIALALASARPQSAVTATDCSPAALAVARTNAGALGISNIAFRHSDWLTALEGEPFDLIVGNPPYIAANDPHLTRGDLRFEPPSALASGADGLDALRTIIAGAPRHLVPGGWLLLEHGHDQGRAVRALLLAAGFTQVTTARDLERRERVAVARMV